MAYATKLEFTTIPLDTRGPFYACQAAGRVVVGTPYDRPYEIIGTSAWKAGLKRPYYPMPFGGPAVGTDGIITLTEIPNAAGPFEIGTKIKIRELWLHPRRDTRSDPGREFGFVLTQKGGFTVNSTCVGLLGETFTHREFYVNAIAVGSDASLTGGFYEFSTVAYSAAGNTSANVPGTVELLVQRRPLEQLKQRGIFPAVTDMKFWKNRFWGGGARTRVPMNCTLTLKSGGGNAGARGTITGFNGFKDADTYKVIQYIGPDATVGSVALKKGTIIGFVDLVLKEPAFPSDSSVAFIRYGPPANLDAIDGWWPGATDAVLVNPVLGAGDAVFRFLVPDASDLYATSLYVGEVAQGISYGYVSWCPLNVVSNDAATQTCGPLTSINVAGDDLVVVYQGATCILSGDPTVGDPPDVRVSQISGTVGSFYPRANWQDGDRRVWFEGHGRLWVVGGNRLTDAGTDMLCARLFYEFFSKVRGNSGFSMRTAYSTALNWSITVGGTAPAALDADIGKRTLVTCHDRSPADVHPIDWPLALKTIGIVPLDVGSEVSRDLILATAGNRVYELFKDGVFRDTVATGQNDATVITASNIAASFRAGVVKADWKVTPRSIAVDYLSPSNVATLTATINALDSRNIGNTVPNDTQVFAVGVAELNSESAYAGGQAAHGLDVVLAFNNGGADLTLYDATLSVAVAAPRKT